MRQGARMRQAPRIHSFSLYPPIETQLPCAQTSQETTMPRTFPIKQGRAANLKPKGRRSKRYGVSSRPNLPQRKKGNG